MSQSGGLLSSASASPPPLAHALANPPGVEQFASATEALPPAFLPAALVNVTHELSESDSASPPPIPIDVLVPPGLSQKLMAWPFAPVFLDIAGQSVASTSASEKEFLPVVVEWASL